LDIIIDYNSCFKAVLKQKLDIAIIALVFFLIGLVVSLERKPDLYTASVIVYSIADESYERTMYRAELLARYSKIVTSSSITQRAEQLLNHEVDAKTIQDSLKVNYTKDDISLTINVSYKDPSMAIRIANAVVESWQIEMETATSLNIVRVLDRASYAEHSFSGQAYQWMVRFIAMLVGILIAIFIISLRQLFFKKLLTIEDFTLDNTLEIIGIIPYRGGIKSNYKD